MGVNYSCKVFIKLALDNYGDEFVFYLKSFPFFVATRRPVQ
jgi:hypothetical protein